MKMRTNRNKPPSQDDFTWLGYVIMTVLLFIAFIITEAALSAASNPDFM